MIKRVLTAAALCSAFSAFAATDLPTDGVVESAFLSAGDDVDPTAIGPAATPTFAAAGTDESDASLLDDVTVIPSAATEPATLAMMGAGLLGIVGLGRRRSRDF